MKACPHCGTGVEEGRHCTVCSKPCPVCGKICELGTYCADCFAICLACHALRPKAEACPDCGHGPIPKITPQSYEEWYAERERLRKLSPSEITLEENAKYSLGYPGDMKTRNPEDAGLKFDADKLRLDLLPIEALEEMSKVYAFGVKKYSAHNWRKGMQWSRLFAACMRHMFAWYRGETQDQESGLNHLVHAAFCIMCLITFEKTHPEKDDRPIENKE